MNWFSRFFQSKAPFSASGLSIEPPEEQRVLELIRDYFESNGGLASVVKRFEERGVLGKVRSWVSTGPNLPINSVEALQLVGWSSLSDMAGKSGLSVDRLRDLLAQLLPAAVDKATPEGKL
ncbi:MAG TPA: YidB family protein [Methylocystis sp.]|nr:YidB family protein [Methylocystis sp.]